MDVPDKHAGITHFALLCPDIVAAKRALDAAGIPLSGGPVTFETGAQAIFVRDPDRNVIELHQRRRRRVTATASTSPRHCAG